jgi:hypothetical protein
LNIKDFYRALNLYLLILDARYVSLLDFCPSVEPSLVKEVVTVLSFFHIDPASNDDHTWRIIRTTRMTSAVPSKKITTILLL